MSYRRDGSIQDAYEDFPHREVIYKRVVSVVEKRSVLRPEQDYVQEYDYDDQRYSGSQSYHDQDGREHRAKNTHEVVDRGGYYGETTRFSSGSRRSSPPRNDSYPYYRGSRDNTPTGRQVKLSGERAGSLPSSRGRGPGSLPCSRGRGPGSLPCSRGSGPGSLPSSRGSGPGSLPSSRGRGPGPPRSRSAGKADQRGEKPMHELTYTGEDHEAFRRREPYPGWERCRSPLRRDAQGCSYQQSQQRNRIPNPNSSLDAVRVQEVPPALVSKPEPGVRVSVESENAPEEDFATRRSREIANKALEIEKLYRQDCITFGTVVNMLVTKEPRLDQLLQAPLHKSLIEIKERCLEDLRHFIKDLDQVASKLGTP
ncbi:periphilin-1-like [Hypomesus transpacificus]|uniref:periphilin-1-like n=1 Tax=Hypomesus transpacificus TaxID=137520 RepID=UPI001F073A47|nr:periphilin-1-like [Hypomesus transpacificus]XP_046889208.1 periphilin-1-like [Hypomesus transpacificus]XP_046889209.1 periphilin-1-like [Hypomesus transpacificus]